MPETPERTALYRYFDDNDDLLYIGISIDPDGRLQAHRDNHEPWAPAVARRTIEWLDSRPLALEAEEEAIKTERPRCNEKHNYDEAPFSPSNWPKVTAWPKVPAIAELMRAEITARRWAHGQRIPSLRTLGAATGASSRIVSQASALLQKEGLLDFQPSHGLFVTRPRWSGPKLPHDWFRQLGFPG
ncbi:GntR family transcriptional regulator [Streptomyces triticiradicis]|uniref:GntR family transcriptional regulator n=1 Tax=Streptomyces triticiradicis TaxID=2651189 RepID=A0A7J5D6C5_9ACTN|nr:GntR family transcriptional regulator [Streptomyces triticiradicis]KAB1979478.1 GntR family transcriptional regulator [Streptomyces triticiradicis]